MTVTLQALGVCVQVGHAPGESCRCPVRAVNNAFVVIDTDGVHDVTLDFCGCEQAAPRYIQLLRASLFPATVTEPKTAATFKVLDMYQSLSNTAKISGYDFVMSLSRRMDNTRPPKVRVSALPFMMESKLTILSSVDTFSSCGWFMNGDIFAS